MIIKKKITGSQIPEERCPRSVLKEFFEREIACFCLMSYSMEPPERNNTGRIWETEPVFESKNRNLWNPSILGAAFVLEGVVNQLLWVQVTEGYESCHVASSILYALEQYYESVGINKFYALPQGTVYDLTGYETFLHRMDYDSIGPEEYHPLWRSDRLRRIIAEKKIAVKRSGVPKSERLSDADPAARRSFRQGYSGVETEKKHEIDMTGSRIIARGERAEMVLPVWKKSEETLGILPIYASESRNTELVERARLALIADCVSEIGHYEYVEIVCKDEHEMERICNTFGRPDSFTIRACYVKDLSGRDEY